MPKQQRDYNQQPGLVRPGMGPGSMPPGQPGFQQPQMTMQGGNYAPNPYPANQMGAAFGGPGYVQGAFPNQGNGWVNPGHNDPNSIRDVMSEQDAEEVVGKYDAMINKLNGIDETLTEVKVGGVSVTNSVETAYHDILRIIKLMEFPEEWIPRSRAKYVDAVRNGAAAIIPKLKNYAAQIIKLR